MDDDDTYVTLWHRILNGWTDLALYLAFETQREPARHAPTTAVAPNRGLIYGWPLMKTLFMIPLPLSPLPLLAYKSSWITL